MTKANSTETGPESFRLTLGSSEYTLVAGTEIEVLVLIANLGPRDDYFVLSVLGVPPSWITYSGAPAIWIPAGAQEKMIITVCPPLIGDGIVGLHAARLYVFQQSAPSKGRELPLVLRVLSEQKSKTTILLAVESTELSAPPGTRLSIPVTVSNSSSEPESLELTVQGIPATWVSLSSPVVSPSAREQKTVILTLQIPAAPEIRAGKMPVKITAVSQMDRLAKAELQISLSVAAFESRGRVGVMLGSVQFSVAPGSSLTIPLTVLNRGLEPDSFRLGIKGIPVSWVSTTTPVTPIKPGETKEISVVIRPPISSASQAGRQRFRIFVASQNSPDQVVEVDCVLTVAAYTQFSAELQPVEVDEQKPISVIVKNEGNTQQVFHLSCSSDQDRLLFEFLQPEMANPSMPDVAPGERGVQPTDIPVPPGQTASFRFTARTRKRPLLSGGVSYSYRATVSTNQQQSPALSGKVNGGGNIPIWLLAIALLLGSYFVCSISSALLGNRLDSRFGTQTAVMNETLVAPQTIAANQTVAASQTVVANQTAAAAEGQADTDGDGLANQIEAQFGTDPNNLDTDNDGLMDGQEVFQTGTNPLIADTDGDGIKDGDEIKLGTNPLNPDSDGDNSPDGVEIGLGTNPLKPDTDGDGLVDGAENKPCPDPLNPDSDRDGIIDGRDLNVCDSSNPSLTATSAALRPTITAVPPTSVPTQPPAQQPTQTAAPQATQPPAGQQPTQPPVAYPTGIPSFTGMILAESDRDGNPEVYAADSSGQVRRMTNNAAADTQAVWDSSLQHFAFTTNRDGNNEIYLMSADGTTATNLTNNPADDRDPAWSVYSQAIIFSSNRDGRYQIYLLKLSNRSVTRLTNSTGNDTQPYWVRSTTGDAGGESILFTSDRDGNQEIYRMRTDGSDQVNLTRSPANDQMAKASRSGKKAVFTTNRDGNQEIYSMTIDGQNAVNLTNNLANDFGACFSPDDAWIGFTSERDGNREIYILSSGGSGLYRLTSYPGRDQISDWR